MRYPFSRQGNTDLPTLRFALVVAVVAAALGGGRVLAQTETPAGSPAQYYEDAYQRATAGDREGAEIQLRNALQIEPDHLPSLILLGETLAEIGENGEAIERLNDALLLGGDSVAILPQLMELYLAQGEYGRLLAEIDADAVPAIIGSEAHAARAQAYTALGRLQDANQELERAKSFPGTSPRIYRAAVTLHLRRGAMDDALAAAETLIDIAPDDNRSWNSYGSVMHALGRRGDAIASYEKSLSLEPNNLDARVALVSVFMELRQGDDAAPHLVYLEAEHPLDPRANYYRALDAARRGDTAKEKDLLNAVLIVLEQMPEDRLASNAPLLMIGALSAFGVGAFEKTTQYIETYRQSRPDDPSAIRLHAATLLALDEPRQASILLSRLYQNYPGDTEIASMLAAAYLQDGSPTQAASLLEEMQSQGRPGIRAQYGEALVAAGRYASGIDILENLRESGATGIGLDAAIAAVRLRGGDVETAEAMLDAIHQQEPDNLVYLNLLGMAQTRVGKADAAERSFRDALAIDPAYVPAGINLARLQAARGEAERALALLDEMLADGPEEPFLLAESARALSVLDQPDEALRRAQQAQRLLPEVTELAQLVVELHLERGENDAAERVAQLYANRNSRSPEAASLHGQTLAAVGKPDKARLVYIQMARAADFNTDILFRVARLQVDIGDFDAAANTLYSALKGTPGHVPSRRLMMAATLDGGHFERALEYARSYREAHPEDPFGFLIGAESHLGLKQWERAFGLFSEAASRGARAEGSLGQYRARISQGDLAGAEAVLGSHFAEGGTDLRLLAARSDLEIKLGKNAEAEQTLTAILARAPNSAVHLNNRAIVRLRLGDLRGARSDASAAVELAGDSAEANDTMGWVLVQAGEPAAALNFLREATARDRTSARYRYHLATALAALGREREALAELEYSLQNDSSATDNELVAQATALRQKLEKELNI